jgi:hypothetical protein
MSSLPRIGGGLLCLILTAVSLSHAATAPLAIVNVRVVDVRNGSVSAPTTVQIVSGRISAIGSETDDVARYVDRLDGTGKYLIPGFWDMHAHVNSGELATRWMFPLFVAFGVTGVRDAAGDCWAPGCTATIGELRNVQTAVANGRLTGPRLVAIGSDAVDGPRAASAGLPEWAAPANAAAARELVHVASERGVDFIKTYDTIPRDAYFALMSEASRLRVPVAGHVPLSVSLIEAVNAGQRSVAHAKHPALDCSAFGAVFRRVFADWAAGRSDWIYASWVEESGARYDLGGYYQHVLATFDADLCREVIAAFAASDAWYVPTLITRRFEAMADDPAFLDDARLALVPPELESAWREDSASYREQFKSPVEKRSYVELYRLAVRLTGRVHKAGVPVLVGTDTPDSYCFPGSGFHDELGELSAAGLSNAEILRAATWDAARFVGMGDSFGSVEVGKTADLVLLDANPLSDIGNARQIAAVFVGGRMLDRATLDELIAGASAYATGRKQND